jgi:PAS domain S-box-containing protein
MEGNYTLLVVDDNDTLLKLSRETFSSLGHKVLTARDGEEALNILNKEKIDLVVTDVLMPNVDGYMLCYRIRSDKQLRDVPVMIYTATYTSASDEALAREIGADKFVRKPAPVKVLAEAAAELLRMGRQPHNAPEKGQLEQVTRQYSEGLVEKLERKNVELEDIKVKLEKSELRLKEAHSIARIGGWELDLTNGVYTWSDECYHLFGVNSREVVPDVDYFIDLIYPADQDMARREIKKAVDSGLDSFFNFRFVRKSDGALRHGLSLWKFEFSGEHPIRLFGIVQDTTEQWEIEQKLIEYNDRYNILSKATNDAIWDWNIETDTELWNHGIRTIFGYLDIEVASSHRWWKNKIHPDDYPRVGKEIQQANANGETNWTSEYRFLCADGSYKNVLDRAYIIYREGKPVRMIGAMQDVTELVQYREGLEEMVRERTQKLNQALEKEKELVGMKSRFISIASHEFRTPLSTISLATGFLQKYQNRMTPEQVTQKLEEIEKQVKQMTFLLDDVLLVGKAEAGKVKINLSKLKLSALKQIAGEAVDGIGTHTLVYSEKCDAREIITDEKLVRNIITNLLTNAVKFSPDRKKVYMDVSCNHKRVKIIVRDEGIGIPPEEIEELFIAFSRGSNVGTIEGTGLGLSIVKKAVDLLNGSLDVKSELGKGTEFKIVVPIQP